MINLTLEFPAKAGTPAGKGRKAEPDTSSNARGASAPCRFEVPDRAPRVREFSVVTTPGLRFAKPGSVIPTKPVWRTEVIPPWQKFPDFVPRDHTDVDERSEAISYRSKFVIWYLKLPSEEAERFKQENPEPEHWAEVYEALDSMRRN